MKCSIRRNTITSNNYKHHLIKALNVFDSLV